MSFCRWNLSVFLYFGVDNFKLRFSGSAFNVHGIPSISVRNSNEQMRTAAFEPRPNAVTNALEIIQFVKSVQRELEGSLRNNSR